MRLLCQRGRQNDAHDRAHGMGMILMTGSYASPIWRTAAFLRCEHDLAICAVMFTSRDLRQEKFLSSMTRKTTLTVVQPLQEIKISERNSHVTLFRYNNLALSIGSGSSHLDIYRALAECIGWFFPLFNGLSHFY